MRLSRETDKEPHHLTIPYHSPLKIGTLNAILDDASAQIGIDKRDIINILFKA